MANDFDHVAAAKAALDFARYLMEYIVDHDMGAEEAEMKIEDIGNVVQVARLLNNGEVSEARDVALDQDTDPREELFDALNKAGFDLYQGGE